MLLFDKDIVALPVPPNPALGHDPAALGRTLQSLDDLTTQAGYILDIIGLRLKRTAVTRGQRLLDSTLQSSGATLCAPISPTYDDNSYHLRSKPQLWMTNRSFMEFDPTARHANRSPPSLRPPPILLSIPIICAEEH